MAKKARAQDLFMQWAPIEVTLDGADSSSLETDSMTTGLSIRGDYGWLIHRLEVSGSFMEYIVGSANQLEVAVAVTDQYTTFPQINEKGVIAHLGMVYALTGASGGAAFSVPLVWPCLPPTIIASPKVTVYAHSTQDDAGLRGKTLFMRFGYTTVPLDDRSYLEIAETFEQI